MSKKNLARSAIEGGRTSSSKWDRRNSHNEERAAERDFCKKAQLDPEIAEESDIKEKTKAYKSFADKLGPLYRWLERQVGKSWDEVRSEVTKAFDTRTTAGRHIVYDHLLKSVEVTPDVSRYRYRYSPNDPNTSYYQHDFYVDENGTLCKRRYVPRNNHNVPAFDTRQIANWLNGRVVGKVGTKLFWFVPCDKNKKRGGFSREWKTEWKSAGYYHWQSSGLQYLYLTYVPVYAKDKDGVEIITDRIPTWVSTTPTFRQDRKLNEKEIAFWNTLPEYYQTKVLEFSPNNPKQVNPNPYRYY